MFVYFLFVKKNIEALHFIATNFILINCLDNQKFKIAVKLENCITKISTQVSSVQNPVATHVSIRAQEILIFLPRLLYCCWSSSSEELDNFNIKTCDGMNKFSNRQFIINLQSIFILTIR